MMISKIFLGEFSISKLSEVKEEQIRIEQDISVLKKSNEEMMNEKNILNSDEGLEGLARSELGLIKKEKLSINLRLIILLKTKS